MAFQKGDEVEVESGELGFIGSYYEATIVSRIGTSCYKVKYKTLLTEDESELLEEIVPASEVRPVPPHIENPEGGFSLYDGVDVFDNDGWWFGFIYGKLGLTTLFNFLQLMKNLSIHPTC
ncbi:PREDICTED: DUF724 domain-containing protein 3-like [Nicotiana attenuata]|uniref:Agenet domain-containing protein n=1 Tax=Nicotiana attenuata TaxID=49451 RepID=A0A1J6HX59_NICAT|nr:PREDICTED: DUF724 domain-containing protein 3-like [Nicotiana attenuata]OIS97428.1 hypothetical protein A4A49_53762 [Nicotiana attenuata]